MATSPEIRTEIPPQVEQVAENYQETPIEAAEGVQSTPSTPTNVPQVQVPSGQTIQPVPSPSDGPSITLPSAPEDLEKQAKGSITNTTTWSAAFWLRMMKKAILKHINILVGGNKPDA